MRRVALWVVIAAAAVLPYVQLRWWPFPVAFVVVVMLLWIGSGRDLSGLGFPRRLRDVAAVAVVFVVCAMLARWWIDGCALREGIERRPYALPYALYPLFQAGLEEILLGYLPLAWLSRRVRPVTAAIGLALLFAALHVALYRLGDHATWISPWTAISLVGVGALRNAWILASGHVGFAWALHAGWNVTMFGGGWYDGDGRWVAEPRLFDLLLGDPRFSVVVLAAALASLAPLLLRRGVGPR